METVRVHIALGWRGSPVTCRDFATGSSITIGSDEAADIPLPGEVLAGRFELVRPGPVAPVLRVPNDCDAQIANGPVAGSAYRDRPSEVLLRRGVSVRLRIGELTLDVEAIGSRTLRSTPIPPGGLRTAAPAAVAAMPAGMLLLTALWLPPPAGDLRPSDRPDPAQELRARIDAFRITEKRSPQSADTIGIGGCGGPWGPDPRCLRHGDGTLCPVPRRPLFDLMPAEPLVRGGCGPVSIPGIVCSTSEWMVRGEDSVLYTDPITLDRPPARPIRIRRASGEEMSRIDGRRARRDLERCARVAARRRPPERGTGGVTIHFAATPAGEMSQLLIARSSGHEEVDRCIVTSMKRWRLARFERWEGPVRVRVRSAFMFPGGTRTLQLRR
jgi:hypothetical protein